MEKDLLEELVVVKRSGQRVNFIVYMKNMIRNL